MRLRGCVTITSIAMIVALSGVLPLIVMDKYRHDIAAVMNATGSPAAETPSTPAAAPAGLQTFAGGDSVVLTDHGARIAIITVGPASQVLPPRGGPAAKPMFEGDIFVAVEIDYRALAPTAYDGRDWALYADGVMAWPAEAPAAPGPRLGAGQIAAGQEAAGWLEWEAPPAGQLDLSFRGGFFDVVVREP